MIRTYGLSHIALSVRNAERAYRFYHDVFGLHAYWTGEGEIHASTPDTKDVITFNENPDADGSSGGIAHFGFRLVDPADIDAAVEAVERAGGTILRRGEFSPGFPYAYIHDLDGYEVEIWYEEN